MLRFVHRQCRNGFVAHLDRPCSRKISTTDKQQLINHVKTVLDQNITVLSTISDEDYHKPLTHFMNASVGSHIRHIIDHFDRIVSPSYSDANVTEKFHYDERERSTDIETNRWKAREKVVSMIDKLDTLPVDRAVEVEFMSDPKLRIFYSIPSYVGRELNFAAHHGVHHLYTVTLMLEALGYTLADKKIGVANSTINNILSKKKA